MKLVLGTIFTTPPTIAVRSDNDGAPGPVIANPTVTILGHETSPEQWARVHLALASPLTLNPGRYWLSVEMGTHNPSWFMTVGASPYVHWSSDAGQTWAQVQGGGDVGFILYGTAATAETKTTDLLNTLGTLGLDAGILNSLQAKLRAALASIASGDDAGTCRALNDLANQISALSGKKLTEAQATDLLAEVDQIRQMIGC
jgi:hypothetical protein